MNHPDFKKYDTSSMVGVGGGGAAFAAPMIKRVKEKGQRCFPGHRVASRVSRVAVGDLSPSKVLTGVRFLV